MVSIVKTRRLYQAVADGIGTVFQDHRKWKVEEYIRSASLVTDYTGYETTTSKPLKYGKLKRM